MKKKKKKIKLKGLLIIFIIILLGVLIFFGYRSLKIKNIYVVGNSLLRESEIIDLASLRDYPHYYEVSTKKIENILKEEPLINEVKVTKSLFGKLTITIKENRILYQSIDGVYTLSNKDKITIEKNLLGIPTIINNPVDYEDKLIEKLDLVHEDILSKVSEIMYQPNDLDRERFMFYMSDGNYVYITLNKITLINSYNEIYPTLEGKKGILYLDSGNHFEIKNNI